MALTGILAGFNEQRGHDINYLAQLDQMRRAQAAQDLDAQRLAQQQAQFKDEMALRQQQFNASQPRQLSDIEKMQLADQQRLAASSNIGMSNDTVYHIQNSPADLRRRDQIRARNALAALLKNGEDVSTADLGRAILPYDPKTGIDLIKASKEEQRQQALLERTGGTGINAPQGYRWTQDGNLEAIPGGSADPAILRQLEAIKQSGKEPKPLTEVQGNAVGFGMRAQEAQNIINDLSNQGVMTGSVIKQGVESVPLIGGALGMAANALVASPEQQQVEQAQRNFVNALLRKESGASISPGEFSNARQQYFPQPGDSQEVIDQKRANRETAINALRAQAGPGAVNIPGAVQQSNQSQEFNALPDPRKYQGKTLKDTSTGTRWMSNGKDWVKQ